jgi:exosortase E/protease (VPEID-CTERM system)
VNDASLQLQKLPGPRFGLLGRLALVVLALVLEGAFLKQFVDFGSALWGQGLAAKAFLAFHWASRLLLALAASIAVFAAVRAERWLEPIEARARDQAIRPLWVLVNLMLIAALVPLSLSLSRQGATLLPFALVAALAVLCAAAATGAAFAAVTRPQIWLRAASSLGVDWLYSGIVAIAGVVAWQWSQSWWKPTAALTFDLVRLVLSPILPALQIDPSLLVIGSDRFAVRIEDYCSGLEGVGFMLVFGCTWLLYFRKEYIFPNALVLLPSGLVLMFALNVLRIATLFLIGNAGFPAVAEQGFHSQAGWMAFLAAACLLAFVSRRIPWLSRTAVRSLPSGMIENPTASYLLPLLAILGAGIVARATSSGLETLYPLRLIAGAAALWLCRSRWAALNWHFSWRGPAVGLLVFLFWILAAHLILPSAAVPSALAALSPVARAAWITSRTLAVIVTVPLAEELAYRGYLMRRLMNRDFESVPFQAIRWPAVLVSAVAFGLAHGSLWLPGVVAGVAYGVLLARSGRMGEAVAAHATSNVLIAALVLFGQQWQLW